MGRCRHRMFIIMKHYYLSFFIATLMSMAYTMASAHDIAVANSNGKTIYYNYNSDGSSVSVTYQGTSYSSYSNEYTGDIVIPETVTYSGQTYSVTTIGSSAFRGCIGLTSVTIPNSVTSIGGSAFSGCSDLTSVTIPNSVTSIGNSAFSGCSGLTSVTIPNSVTSIGASAFYACSGLTSVIIPNSVTSISSSAFNGCSGLTSVTWNAKNYPAFSRYSSSPFYNIRTQITEFIIGDDVTSVPADMCYEMSNLKSINIPNSVTSIGGDAFYGCSGLEKVIVPNFDIKKWCCIEFGFYSANPLYYAHHLYSDENTEITKLVIPDGVTSIGDYAFEYCSGLTSVTIPNSVTSIGDYAFEYCSGLTSVTIHNSVTSIGDGAFIGCSGLEKVIVPNIDIKNWCSIEFGHSGNPLQYAHHLYSDENTEITELVIPDGVTSIGSSAFYKCSGLTSVTIPNSVTNIGSYAFCGCSGLTSVNIGNNVTSIGNSAFSGCSGLTSVTIPNSVTSIGSSAFSGCSGLKKVIVPDIKTWCSIEFGAYYYSNPLQYAHHLYSDENTEITKLVIPDGVTIIGSSAFIGCSGLTSVTIPNSVTSIGGSAFSSCSGLTSVTIPNSVTSIGYSAFSGCSGLTSVTIPNSVTSIGGSAFYNCSGLTSVTIPNSVTSIGDGAFSGCSGLTSVTIPNSVTSIGSYAFYGCSGLTSVNIGNNVTSIGSYAFKGSTSMTKFKIRATVPPTCGAQALDDINKLECTLYVPMESIDDYKAMDPWKNFSIEKIRMDGDSNGDDTVTMADANAIVNYFLAKGTDGFVEGDFDEETADVNEDGSVTMADANQIVNMFLSGEK